MGVPSRWLCFPRERGEATVFADDMLAIQSAPSSHKQTTAYSSDAELLGGNGVLHSEASNLSSLPSISLQQNEVDQTVTLDSATTVIETTTDTNSGRSFSFPSDLLSVETFLKQQNASSVSCLAIAGDLLLTASSSPSAEDEGVTIWKLSASQTPWELSKIGRFGDGAVKSIVVNRNTVYTAHQDRRIRVWTLSDNADFRRVATLPTLKDYLRNLFVTPSAQKGRYVDYNRRRGRRCRELMWMENADVVSCVAMTQPGSGEQLLYSGSWDRSVKVWRVRDLACVESFRAHDDAINAILALSCPSKSSYVFTASSDSTIKLWERHVKHRRHVLVTTLRRHRSAVNALALTENGDLLYSGGAGDKCIVVWQWQNTQSNGDKDNSNDNRKEGEEKMRVCGALRGHRAAILCLATCGNGLLCSGSADKTIRVWKRLESNDNRNFLHCCVAVLEGHGGPVKSVSMKFSEESPSSLVIYSGGLDRQLRLWLLSSSSSQLLQS